MSRDHMLSVGIGLVGFAGCAVIVGVAASHEPYGTKVAVITVLASAGIVISAIVGAVRWGISHRQRYAHLAPIRDEDSHASTESGSIVANLLAIVLPVLAYGGFVWRVGLIAGVLLLLAVGVIAAFVGTGALLERLDERRHRKAQARKENYPVAYQGWF